MTLPGDLRVSVIVPAYNAAATIAETLASLVSQTFAHWEAVVVDDGSTDDTGPIVRTFAERDGRIRLITRTNGGESAARNTGIAEARFDWLLFLDADDWISPAHLERMTGVLAADASLDAAHCGYARVAADGTQVVERYEPPVGDLFSTLARRAAFPVHACIVRKSLVTDVGMFDTSLRTSPDWDLWQRVARTGAQFGAVRDVLAFYRMSPHGASLDAGQLFSDDLRVLRQGHQPDPRVPRPHPDHAQGAAPDGIATQEFYLLCWCAGLRIGAGDDARSFPALLGEDRFPELYPDAVAQCLFESVPLPTCRPPRAWEHLWPTVQDRVSDFLRALEAQSAAPELASIAMRCLKRRILEASPIWNLVSEEVGTLVEQLRHSESLLADERSKWPPLVESQRGIIDGLGRSQELLEQERSNWQRVAETREQTLSEQAALVQQLQQSLTAVGEARAQWQRAADERARAVVTHQEIIGELERTHALTLAEQAALVQQLQQSLTAVDEAREIWQRAADERAQAIVEHQEIIRELERTHALTIADEREGRALVERQLRRRDESLREADRELGQRDAALLRKTEANARLQEQLHSTEDAHRETASRLQLAQDAVTRANRQRLHLEETIEWTRAESDRLQELVKQTEAARQEQTTALRQHVSAVESSARGAQRRQEDEIVRLRSSPQWRVGHALWNGARLSSIGRPAARVVRRLQDRRTRKQLASASAVRGNGAARPRAIVAACWDFPIASQTFVYQEMQGLEWAGFDYQIFCCQTNAKDALPSAFEDLWSKHVVLTSDWSTNRRDFEYFLGRDPERVESLLARLGETTGLSRDALLLESIVMMGFTFARCVELSGATYLHTYFFYDQSFMALMTAWLLRIPRGVTAYADHMLDDYAFKCVPLHLELADIVVATSERIKGELSALGGGRFDDKIIVKPNGINTARFPPVSPIDRLKRPGPPELISVSRIEPKKGLIYLVEAVGILKTRGVDVKLNIVGGVDTHTATSAAYYQELTARIESLGLSDRVVLHGAKQQAEFLPLLAQSRIFLAPYVEVASGDKDGIPTALLEAMSTGLPVIATGAGSIDEAAADGVEALSVPQRDPMRLADAIERLLADPSMFTRMSEAARRRAVLQFDARVTERTLHERIHACLARPTA